MALTLNEKDVIKNQYQSLIDDIKKTPYVNNVITIAYVGPYKDINLLGEDRADTWLVTSNSDPSEKQILNTWLFIDGPYKHPDDKDICYIKYRLEIEESNETIIPLGVYQNQQLMYDRDSDFYKNILNELMGNGDKGWYLNKMLLISMNAFQINPIEILLKFKVTEALNFDFKNY